MLRAHHRSWRRVVAHAVAVAAAVAPAPALASPPDTAFVEDVHLHPSGPAELQLAYELVSPGVDGLDAVELIALRAAAGFDRAPLDFQLTAGAGQARDDVARLDHFGLRARFRIAGTPGEPGLIAFGGYRRLLAADAHLAEQGAVGRWARRGFSVTGEVSAREVLGGDQGSQVELRVGASATYGFAIDYGRVGVEAFALLPLTGRRVSDLALGGDADAIAVYAGPSLRLHFEYVWVSAAVVTGAITDGGARVLARTTLAVQF